MNPRVSEGWRAAGWAIVTAGLFLMFRSQQYLGDGVRHLPAITQATWPRLSEVRHAGFPLLGWAWYRLMQALGYHGDPIPAVQAMNAICGGLGVGLFYLLAVRLTRDRAASGWAALLLAASAAYNNHATDMTEPMPAVPLILGSTLLAIRGAQRQRISWVFLGAVGMTLAAFLYLTSVLTAIAIAWLMLAVGRAQGHRRPWALAAIFLVATGLGVSAAFLAAYRPQAASWGETVRLILSERAAVLGTLPNPGLKLIHFGGTVLGWAGAILGLEPSAASGRFILAHLHTWPARWNLGIVVFMTVMTTLLVRMLRQSRRQHLNRVALPRWLWGFGALWMTPGILLAWGLAPAYDKMWLYPLLGWYFLLACSVASLREAGRWRRGARLWLAVLASTVVGVNLLMNMAPRRILPSPYLEDAKQVVAVMGERDLLVTESYDLVSVYTEVIFRRPVFSIFVTGWRFGFDNDRLYDRLRSAMDDHRRAGGHIYFIMLFDPPAEGWEAGMGGQRGLTYQPVLAYRRDAKPVLLITSLSNDLGRPIWLWEYPEQTLP